MPQGIKRNRHRADERQANGTQRVCVVMGKASTPCARCIGLITSPTCFTCLTCLANTCPQHIEVIAVSDVTANFELGLSSELGAKDVSIPRTFWPVTVSIKSCTQS